MTRALRLPGLSLGLLWLAACGSGGSGRLEVSGVRANLTLPSDTGAVYMTIANGTDQDERLLGATVPGCGAIELHEMTMDGDVMIMRQVEGGELPIPAGETVELVPSGLHVMCIGKTGNYAVGDTIPVTLEFAAAGTIEVTAEVVAPGEMDMEGMDH